MSNNPGLINIIFEYLENVGFSSDNLHLINEDNLNINISDNRIDINTYQKGEVTVCLAQNPYDTTTEFNALDPDLLLNIAATLVDLLIKVKDDFVLELQNAQSSIEVTNNLMMKVIANANKYPNMHGGVAEVG
jgi:hypothetical protein